ncbi:hypothetical protein NDU88_006125 [Pleurodeles waltl]|uniref:Uncharacterized protein n=1 Tax=Pleurodeles waltl TaxID=8319 RepID=A0AAV7TXK6_PLEWA|nr:hypothetical protein NDU88_006125 [Pleurodeles waltl]
MAMSHCVCMCIIGHKGPSCRSAPHGAQRVTLATRRFCLWMQPLTGRSVAGTYRFSPCSPACRVASQIAAGTCSSCRLSWYLRHLTTAASRPPPTAFFPEVSPWLAATCNYGIAHVPALRPNGGARGLPVTAPLSRDILTPPVGVLGRLCCLDTRT